MKKRFTEAQIVFALRQVETGTPIAEIIRKMGVSEPIFYRWKKCTSSDHSGIKLIEAFRYMKVIAYGLKSPLPTLSERWFKD